MKKRKHHIYTIVVSKRRRALIMVIILSVIAGIVCASIVDSSPGSSYSDFIMMSCDDILNSPPSIPQKKKSGICAKFTSIVLATRHIYVIIIYIHRMMLR